MPTLPPSSDIIGSTITEGQAKTWFSSVRTYIATLLGAGGTQGEALTALGVPMHGSIPKTGAYTVVATDRGKVVKCAGTWSLSLTAVATLGDGFAVCIANDGAGVITIDANLSELIDGATTLALAAGKSLSLYCDGTKWISFGRGGVESFNTRSGAVTLTSGDVTGAGGALSGDVSQKISKDMGGSYPLGCIGYMQSAASVAAGATVAGVNLSIDGHSALGTWRNVTNFNVASMTVGMFQRIS
jgi:hypothetical protein